MTRGCRIDGIDYIAAVLFAKNLDYVQTNRAVIVGSSLLLSALFATMEWRCMVSDVFFPVEGFALPTYTRVSLLFGIIAVVALAINPSIRTIRPIRFMARNSLGLFCLHFFIFSAMAKLGRCSSWGWLALSISGACPNCWIQLRGDDHSQTVRAQGASSCSARTRY